MSKNYNKVRTCVWLLPSTIKKIDALIVEDETSTSRGEIIEKAIECYKSHTHLNQDIDYVAPILKDIIESTVKTYFERVNRNMFKEATELNILTRCVAKSFMIDEDSYQRIRKIAVDEVRKHKGSLNILEAQE